jgi:hypothetical protein
MKRLRYAAMVLAALAGGCGDDVQFAEPPKRTAPPTKPDMPAGHPPTAPSTPSEAVPSHADPFADQGGGAKVEAPTQDPNAVAVAGEIALGEGATAPTPPFTLFVSLVEGAEGRMPVLVKKFDSPAFPARFDLKYGDNPTKAVVDASKAMHLRASISKTGDVMKSTNRTTSSSPIKLGQTDAKLALKP